MWCAAAPDGAFAMPEERRPDTTGFPGRTTSRATSRLGERDTRRRDETRGSCCGSRRGDEPFEWPLGSHAAGDGYLMNDAWSLLALVAVWLLLQHVILPRLGVPT